MGAQKGPAESSNAELFRAKLYKYVFLSLNTSVPSFAGAILEQFFWRWWSTLDSHWHKQGLNLVRDIQGAQRWAQTTTPGVRAAATSPKRPPKHNEVWGQQKTIMDLGSGQDQWATGSSFLSSFLCVISQQTFYSSADTFKGEHGTFKSSSE